MAVSAVLQLTFLGLALTEQQHIGVRSAARSGAGLEVPLLGNNAQGGTDWSTVNQLCAYSHMLFPSHDALQFFATDMLLQLALI
jgi:hypothetical protein